ncbi:ABC transporter ATP-binding protein [Alkalibacterium olivapovliticus]|uniref:Multiple sugar transport system ATP-binding protein n=1 Tax=Alkalibacterium olivapovliticus TaxID=99907 RepID=A0A2T0W8S4_9LACT|nr:sn-glycerol-3-phosphate ABC transporter ATP-binding protein UgpC [Alkalibacterium olivapovliticus]PRY83117.1 multiple sugar transport system ATP-binding protein [Alkalibacterium olivapovliticus]
MAEVKLRQVTKRYDEDTVAVKPLDLDIKDKEFIVFVGPSGCGKSTTLRMIAGLERISDGGLYIGRDIVNHLAPKDRDIAMVFQNYALYPNMTIYDNIGFSLKMKKIKKSERDERVREAAGILGLSDFLDRKPASLSGGQRQRVALGRAMVRNPKVFLLDEPLSNLDAKLRVAMRAEIVKLHRKLETTFVYVTHDQTEAMTMGDRIAVLNDGYLEQIDTPFNVYEYPETKFVAEFIGSPQMNVFETELRGNTIKLNNKSTRLGNGVTSRLGLQLSEQAQTVYAGIRPEAFQLVDEADADTISVVVENVENMGRDTYISVSIAEREIPLIARIPSESTVMIGDTVQLKVDGNKWHVFDRQTERSLLRSPFKAFSQRREESLIS